MRHRSALPATLVVAIAGATLAGWFINQPLLTSWRAGTVPMAPSTAALALLLGSGLLLNAGADHTRRRQALTCGLAAVAGLASAWLLVDRLRGVYSGVEHLGLSISGQVANAPVGFISPVTAAAFVAASVALALIACHGRWLWTTVLSAGLAAFLAVGGFVFVLLNIFGVPLLSRGVFIPPAFNTSLLICALGLALTQQTQRERRVMRAVVSQGRARAVFVAIALAVAAATVSGSYAYYLNEERELRHHAEQELDAISRLKVAQVSVWRRERLADGATLWRNPAFASLVTTHLSRGDDASGGVLRRWLEGYASYPDYDAAYIVDPAGGVRLTALTAPSQTSGAVGEGVRRALELGVVQLVDFHLDDQNALSRLAVVIPIPSTDAPGAWAGAVVLGVNPAHVLAPFVEGWPNSSATGETMLVRRDGDDVVLLTTPRFAAGGAMRHRTPVADTRWIASQAALGHEGPAEGLDYHGAPAIGVLRRVPESPWSLVTLVDRHELDGTLWVRLRQVVTGAGLLLFGLGMSLAYVWQRQRTSLEIARQVEERRAQRLAQLYSAQSLCNEAIIRCTTPAELFAHVCEVAVTNGGLAMAWVGLVDEDTRRVRPVAAFGRGTEYLDGIEISVDESSPLGRGPTGRAIREGQPRWSADFARDQATAPWSERGKPYGWAASGAIPLTRDGRPIGALTVYGTSQDTFDDDSRRLLVEMGANISFALEAFERDARRRDAEIRVQENEELYRKLFSEGRLARLLVDPATQRIVEANAAAVALYGWPAEELVGKPVAEINTATEATIREAMAKATQEGQTRFEFRHRTASGRLIDVEVLSSSVTVRGRALLMSTILDVTEQKQLQAQYLQSQKMEVVGRLAGGIAHDFNNLLTVINGTADLARTELPEGSPLRADLDSILEAGARAAQLTKQLLAFSRRQVVSPVALDVGRQVQATADMLRRLLGADVALTIEVDAQLPAVVIDPGQLEQVILNLAVNARDAMPGGGTLHISVRRVPAGVELTVRDTGTGMTDEVRARIFEPFFTTKEVGRGTGLGLATVFGIVKQVHGTIVVDTAVGRGTAFVITFPAEPTPAA